MGKQQKAREEAQFLRGDVGVDGQATEETKDLAELERGKAREQFLRGKAYLGREFLTWLLWKSEAGEALLEHDGDDVAVVLCDRLLLKGIAGDVVEMTVRGTMAPYSPLVRQALDRGLLIHQARLRLMHGERTYQLTVDAEFLDIKSAKLPELMSEEDDDQVQERLYLSEQLSQILQLLLEHFLRLRAGRRWNSEIVPEMKEWMQQPEAPKKEERRRSKKVA